MKSSIKLIVGMGILSSGLLFGSSSALADETSANASTINEELNIELDSNSKNVLDNLGNVEEHKIENDSKELKKSEDYEVDLSKVKQSIKDLEQLKETYKTNKNSLKEDITELNDEIEIANNKIIALEEGINNKKVYIEDIKEELLKLYKEIQDMEDEKKEREEKFKDRVVSIQHNKEITMVEVLIQSDSFGDMLNRFFNYKKIVDADNRAIEEYLELIDKLEKAKDKSEKLKEQLEKELKELEDKKADLVSQKNELDGLLKKKERQNMSLDEILADIDKDIQKLNQSILNIELNKTKADVVAKLKAQVEKERQEAIKNNIIYSYADLSDNKTVFAKTDDEIAQGKIFITPTEGRFTSGYGPRVVGGEYGYHRGIDLANPVGTAILSSAEGKVLFAGPKGTYGNVIFVSHTIDGKDFVTVYAHLSKIGVREGDEVEQGQVIGLMGNTGRSTGPHLHFEIQENTAVYNYGKTVDPWKYLTSKLNDNIVREGHKEIDRIKAKNDD